MPERTTVIVNVIAAAMCIGFMIVVLGGLGLRSGASNPTRQSRQCRGSREPSVRPRTLRSVLSLGGPSARQVDGGRCTGADTETVPVGWNVRQRTDLPAARGLACIQAVANGTPYDRGNFHGCTLQGVRERPLRVRGPRQPERTESRRRAHLAAVQQLPLALVAHARARGLLRLGCAHGRNGPQPPHGRSGSAS